MIQCITKHHILWPQDGLEESRICIEAGGEEYRILGPVECADRRLQLLVDVLGAAYKPDGGHTQPVPVERGERRMLTGGWSEASICRSGE